MKYQITSSRWDGQLELEYNAEGVLAALRITGVEPVAHAAILNHLPKSLEMLDALSRSPDTKVVEIPEDISFDRFWLDYKHKVGKEEAKKKWASMKEADKIKAILYIPIYNTYLINCQPTPARLHPATYLNKKRWLDNE